MGMETLKVLTHTRPKPATHDRDVAARHVTGWRGVYLYFSSNLFTQTRAKSGVRQNILNLQFTPPLLVRLPSRDSNEPLRSLKLYNQIAEKAPTMGFSWLKVATTAFHI